MRRPFLPLLAAAGLVLSACATPDPAAGPQGTQTAQVQSKDCNKTLGTSICRRDDGGAVKPNTTISGENLRRSGTVMELPPPPPSRE